MPVPDTDAVTRLVQDARGGDPRAADQLLPVLYAELRRLARARLRDERPGHTLQATALVHEVYLRLVDQTRVQWQDRNHFFAVAAQAIRRILVDHARGRARRKRGGGAPQVPLEEAVDAAAPFEVDLLELHRALDHLAAQNPLPARVVELRFFGGLTSEESAAVLGISPRTAERHWQFARAWLYQELADAPGTGEPNRIGREESSDG